MTGLDLLRRTLLLAMLIITLVPLCLANKVVQLRVNGTIGPATADYLSRGIANAQHATLIYFLSIHQVV